ncbi:MAG: hypothetical protein IIA87_03585 [Nanoarchaeota archaeon]|nr:hypothetical protein [Nanoarchaeota archaeon]
MTIKKVIRDKALVMFLDGRSEINIGLELDITPLTIRKWKKKYDWYDLREKTEKKTNEKVSNKYSDIKERIIKDQIIIGDKANKELLKRLKEQEEINKQIEEYKKDWIKMNKEEKLTKDEIKQYWDTLNTLLQQKMQNKDLISVLKHTIDVIRPRTTITKNLNMNIDIDRDQINKQVIQLVTDMEDGIGYSGN